MLGKDGIIVCGTGRPSDGVILKEEATETVDYPEANRSARERPKRIYAVSCRLRHVQLGRAGLKHWHGPSPTNAMTHIAIQESLDGKNVEWMKHVTDAQYVAGVSAG